MISRLRLSARGYALVAGPILCQIAILVMLVVLLLQVQSAASAAARAKAAISQAHMLAKTLSDATVYSMLAQKTLGLLGSEQLETKLSAMRSHLNKLDILTQENQSAADTAQLKLLTTRLSDLLQQEATGSLDEHAGIAVLNSAAEYSQILGRLIAKQEIELEKYKTNLSGQQENLKSAITVSIAGSVLLALGLAYIYAVSIKKPIEQLYENAYRISTRRKLLPVMEGQDELVQLDRIFHRVDNDIAAELYREMSLFENAADLIICFDSKGSIRIANPAIKEMFGITKESVLRKPISFFVPKVQHRYLQNELKTVRNNPGMPRSFELSMLSPSGSILDTLWSTSWSQEEQRFFCVVHDITERKEIERTRDEFITMLSHDLRAPLRVVQDSMKSILSDTEEQVPEDLISQLAPCSQNLERMIFLVNDLLDFENLQAGKIIFNKTKSSMQDLFEETVRLVSSFALQRHVEIISSPLDIFADVDQQKILQVMLNLLTNAIKFSPEGGRVWISCCKQNGHVKVEVQDEGAGIPVEFQNSIFSPFEQVPGSKKEREGTGLGLAICKSIIEGHAGNIGVRSLPDKGSSFWFVVSQTLPTPT